MIDVPKKKLYAFFFIIIMLCVMFFAIGYGYAYRNAGVHANKQVEEWIGDHCVIPCENEGYKINLSFDIDSLEDTK